MTTKRWIRSLLAGFLLVTGGLAFAQGGAGTFKAAMQTSPPTLDIMASTAFATREAAFYFMEGLVAYDENYKVVPMLAKSWDVNQDHTVYTFHLRSGVHFQNGEVMSAKDVVASFERFLNVSPRKSRFSDVVKAEAVDNLTVTFRLSKPDMTFLAALASPLSYAAVMPADIITGKGVGQLTVKDLIGTGPYKLEEWKPNQYIHLVRFDNYAVDNSRPMSGLAGAKIAHFKDIYLYPVTEPSARLAGIKSGKYDYAEALPRTQYKALQGDSAVQTFITKPGDGYVLEFNHAAKWSSNHTFRQAIQAALNMKDVARAMTNGQDAFFKLQPSLFFPEQKLWWNDAGASLYNQNNVAKAKELLKESGYKGEKITLLTNRDYPAMYRAVLAVADQLKTRLGMNVDVKTFDWAGQRAYEKNRTGWQLTPTYFSLRFDPSDYESDFATAAHRKFYSNPKMDAALQEGDTATTLAGRQAAYKKMQQIFYQDVVDLKLADVFSLEAVRSDVQGYKSWYTPRFWGVTRK